MFTSSSSAMSISSWLDVSSFETSMMGLSAPVTSSVFVRKLENSASNCVCGFVLDSLGFLSTLSTTKMSFVGDSGGTDSHSLSLLELPLRVEFLASLAISAMAGASGARPKLRPGPGDRREPGPLAPGVGGEGVVPSEGVG